MFLYAGEKLKRAWRRKPVGSLDIFLWILVQIESFEFCGNKYRFLWWKNVFRVINHGWDIKAWYLSWPFHCSIIYRLQVKFGGFFCLLVENFKFPWTVGIKKNFVLMRVSARWFIDELLDKIYYLLIFFLNMLSVSLI